MIKLIDTKKITSHPDNPRKDLGELEELVDSITTSGILQNLTIVPWYSVGDRQLKCRDESMEDVYTVVIGHRRLAAARLAGLEKVPCVIADMDHKTQVATMLLENMQRSDLTVYEQAQGIQMMMNLGESVANISEKTGFSETTIRRRIKLLELDQEKFKESTERNISLMEYTKLDKIESIELRNEVLEHIGTNNFEYELRRAISKEEKAKWIAQAKKALNEFATETDERPDGFSYVANYHQGDQIAMPGDAGETVYFYVVSEYGYISLYEESKVTEEDLAKEEKRERENARSKALEEVSRRTYALRRDFIKNVSNRQARDKIAEIVAFGIRNMLDAHLYLNQLDIDGLGGLSERVLSENEDKATKELLYSLRLQPYRFLLFAFYAQVDSNRRNYFRWGGHHCEDETLDEIYNFLNILGYEMSDEEQQLQDGTHHLFKEEEQQE